MNASDAQKLSGCRALWVEDLPASFGALPYRLQCMGVDVVGAHSVREAMQHLGGDEGFDFVILDLYLPLGGSQGELDDLDDIPFNGMHVYNAIQEQQGQRPKVICLTAYLEDALDSIDGLPSDVPVRSKVTTLAELVRDICVLLDSDQ